MSRHKRVVYTREFLEFRDEFNKRADAFGCRQMPKMSGLQNMYRRAAQLVEQYGATWPTWEEIEAGVKGMAAFGFAPTDPGWYLGRKGDNAYPNILSCVGHGRKTADTNEAPRTQRFSERDKGC